MKEEAGRNVTITIKISEKESELIHKEIEKTDISLSSFCREIILNYLNKQEEDFLIKRNELPLQEEKLLASWQKEVGGLLGSVNIQNEINKTYEDLKSSALKKIEETLNSSQRYREIHGKDVIEKIDSGLQSMENAVERGEEVLEEIYQINNKLSLKQFGIVILVGLLSAIFCFGFFYFEKSRDLKRLTAERSKWNLISEDFNNFIVEKIYPGMDDKQKKEIDGFYKSIVLPTPREQTITEENEN